jgi:hypothetical protein
VGHRAMVGHHQVAIAVDHCLTQLWCHWRAHLLSLA